MVGGLCGFEKEKVSISYERHGDKVVAVIDLGDDVEKYTWEELTDHLLYPQTKAWEKVANDLYYHQAAEETLRHCLRQLKEKYKYYPNDDFYVMVLLYHYDELQKCCEENFQRIFDEIKATASTLEDEDNTKEIIERIRNNDDC